MGANSNSTILAGNVVSNKDVTKTGKVWVILPDIGSNAVEVVYTSPFYNRNNGGFVAIPEEGAEVLVLANTGNGKFYYLNTIVDYPDELIPGGIKDWKVLADKYIFTDRLKPQRITFTDAFGAGLTISQRTLPNFISAKVDLVSRAGKKVSLSDSPESDFALIRNEHGDGIVISSEPTDVYSERSIEIKSKGAQRQVSYQSDITIMVVEGRDINIENYSTGANGGLTGERSGNINLKSQNSDINIVSNSTNGRVFVITPNARIQIDPDGNVFIDSSKSIQMRASEDITLIADKTIHLQAESINMKTERNISSDAGGLFSAKASGNAILKGANVHLNSQEPPTVTAKQPSPLDRTDYNE